MPTIGVNFPIIKKLEMKIPPKSPVITEIEIPTILFEIGRCESHNHQFDADGNVYRGKINPKDVGKYQINEYYHLADSKRLGMDIYTEKGNTLYALYLLKTQGTTPWNWSKFCWNHGSG